MGADFSVLLISLEITISLDHHRPYCVENQRNAVAHALTNMSGCLRCGAVDQWANQHEVINNPHKTLIFIHSRTAHPLFRLWRLDIYWGPCSTRVHPRLFCALNPFLSLVISSLSDVSQKNFTYFGWRIFLDFDATVGTRGLWTKPRSFQSRRTRVGRC